MKDIFIVVPTLDPDVNIMTNFINELHKEFKNILIVNDGCNKKYDKFFKELEKDDIEIIKHYKNLGKGRGLKNAFNYLLNKYPKLIGCVTCDSDGQHSVNDIKKCALSMLSNPDKLILGVRDFNDENVPKKSMFGNKITRNVFKNFVGLDITDTQTGLRGFSKKLMIEFLDTDGERYEYETKMLISCKEKDIKIEEKTIETIYINGNITSHFNPINDSIKIYSMFSKFFLYSLSSYLIDILLFIIFFHAIRINSKVLGATIIARIVSSIYNHCINRNYKFKNLKSNKIIKYYCLVFAQMLLSGCFTTYIYNLIKINVVIIKILVDLVIWIINLYIQSDFIFVGDKDE